MLSEIVVPVSSPNIGQYIPDILGALFFAAIAYVAYRLMPKALLLLAVVAAFVLLYAFGHR